MKKSIGVLLILLLLVSLAGCSTAPRQPAQKTPEQNAGTKAPAATSLTITLPTWTGYGPLFLAKEKGFFAKHGLDVQLTVVQGLAERKQALAGNQVQGMATAQDVQVTLAAAGLPIKVVWVLDESAGGDGILAKDDIKSVADLKGKTVALEVGSTSHLFLLTALQQAGLSDKDVKIAQMSAADAGAAFVSGKVDAAVTWEPWLSQAVAQKKGHVLLSSKDLPGIIVDSVSLRSDFVEAHPEAVQGFVAALAEAMDYYKTNPDDAASIMAKGLGIDVKEFTETAKGLRFFDAAANKSFFGTADKPGPIYATTEKAADFYKAQKLIDTLPKAADLIDPTFVSKL
ncbi:MAG: NitT/TauT family transport system substrate-binding protein [Bacillota bacterium]|jgi:NitT/TauT family transport system substrate-binding protein|nr:NitT/TauT family transport system substrate-binding protein [Bacillota bacterium]MDK2856537.1 NitT/TauT family transport system substrate-binding protein [Bacillota bacterium]MDK2926115.1 NitT/TauT family transport system substrate-binding protein [Bacillota bacterium]